ncbi:alpha-galactosidase [Oceanivirga salmonicida]|uniref:alpha-galactosidase n=1 Tax=Oceanivirga salmonicida TaxID=1769291 RepID=UPI0012E13578|nr:alpha-galactosidase [Oceanivirga salmonicida]
MIHYNEKNKIFHLYNDEISYIIKVLKNGEIGHLYFGEKIEVDNLDYLYREYYENLPITPNFSGTSKGFFLDTLLREYPDFGRGDFRIPAFELEYTDEDFVSEYKYNYHEIIKGYNKVEKLPHIKASESETLLIYLKDELKNSTLILKYTIFNDYPAIIRNTKLLGKDIKIERLSSLSLDLIDSDYDLISLSGHWGRECKYNREKLNRGIKTIDSKRGSSSATYNPFIALSEPNSDFDKGIMIGFNLIYSGNFEVNIEVSPFNSTRVNMGINSFSFNSNLKDSFETPEVLMVYTTKGLNGLSQVYHDIYRNYLLEKKENLVLLNNWEGTYFDFNEEKLLKIIDSSHELGIDLFVLDDGWFGVRNDDFSGLGDWTVNTKKLPNGLKALWQRTKSHNMKFGLWFEPEMVNENSKLYKEHPDYIIGTKNRVNHPGRNQLVLDFSREEVRENIYNQLVKILDNNEIDYIKWDMNRAITGIDKKEKYFAYIIGLYSMLDKLKKKYPNILFEGCASGGNRFDAGILYYMPQIWTSDNTDAISRVDIQFGASIPYPVSTQGSHVSNVPNHQTGRQTSLEIRRNIAMFGTFGYELNPLELSDLEKDLIKKDIKLYKKYSNLICEGDLYRITYDENVSVFNVVSKDKKSCILAYFRKKVKVLEELKTIKIKGLNYDYNYDIYRINKNREEILIGSFNGKFLEKFGIYGEHRFAGSIDENKEIYSDNYTELYIIKKNDSF